MKAIKQQLSRWREIEGMDSPLVRWGGLLSILIILWSSILSPYLQWNTQQKKLFNQKIRKASSLQALQSAEKKWQQAEQQYEQVKQDMLTALFQQPSYVSAQTTLLTLLRELAKKHQITIISQHLEENEEEPSIGQKIGITLSLKGELSGLLSFIDSLSQHDKLLNIEKLSLYKNRNISIAASLKISGFRLIAEPK